MRGEGCGSCVRAFVAIVEFGRMERILCVFIFAIDGADGLGVVVVHYVDLGLVVSSLCILTRFVLLHPLPAFFLSVALKFTEIAVFAILVVVVSASGIAGTSAVSCLISSSSGVVSSSA